MNNLIGMRNCAENDEMRQRLALLRAAESEESLERRWREQAPLMMNTVTPYLPKPATSPAPLIWTRIKRSLGILIIILSATGCTQFRETVEQVDFKASYEGAAVGTRIHIREPLRRTTGYEK